MPGRTRGAMLCVVVVVVATACSPSGSTHGAAAPALRLTTCQDLRPEICTANYDPVCGHLADGNFETHANACE